eukprot:Skav224739  [mRNA]  locus=scaffold3343:67664:77589:- [translate_table: standard]
MAAQGSSQCRRSGLGKEKLQGEVDLSGGNSYMGYDGYDYTFEPWSEGGSSPSQLAGDETLVGPDGAVYDVFYPQSGHDEKELRLAVFVDMSAAKLEKKVASLEKRLQDELRAALEPVMLRLDQIEEQLRGRIGSRDSTPKAEFEAGECRGELEGIAVVPQALQEVKGDQSQPKLQIGHWVDGHALPAMAEADVDEEPIPFAETIWNVVLVLGHTGAGWTEVVIASLLTILGTFMQVIFVAVLFSDSFLGEPVEEQVRAARQWRAGSAHDVKHMDLAMTSLVSRVCSGDGSLILSTGQADLIVQINQFLGIQNGEVEPKMVPPGTTLCMLCIGLWCVVLGGEFRSIATSLYAAGKIPRSARTVMERGSFVSISYGRFGSYLLMRLARTAVAFCLLIAGTQWLARTSSITDLILNSVALEAILQSDEMIFASLFPKKIQVAIYELEPLKIRYTRRMGQFESCSVGLLFCVAVLVPFFLWVKPIADMMLLVKSEYCGGDQNFVVSLNQDMQMYMGFATVPYENVSTALLGQLAVMEHSKERFVNETLPKYILFANSLDTFETNRFKSMKEAASQFPYCLDYDHWPLGLQTIHGASFRSAALQLGKRHATSCADLAEFCDQWGARLLRLVCGPTCGCADPRALPWFKAPGQGCSTACRREALATAAQLPCNDANTTENWQKFWQMYPGVISAYMGQDLLQTPEGSNILKFVEIMTTLGCTGLHIIGPVDGATGANWCEGSEQFFSPLALICPDACGCATGPSHCADSCRTCGDAATFPANPVASNCAEAKAIGICDVATDAKAYCSETCGICNGSANYSSAVCEDAPIPPDFIQGIDCGKALIGLPRLRPVEYARLKQREKRVSRAYGGSRCAHCVRSRIVRAFLIEEQKCVKQVLAEKLSQAKEKEGGR